MFENIDWLNFILNIIVVLLGSGAISAFITNNVNKKLAIEQKKHEKELSEIKIKLELNAYISKKYYDNELQMYREIWDCASSLYSLMECDYKIAEDKQYDLTWISELYWREYNNNYKEFANTFGKYEPFIEESVCANMHNLKEDLKKYKKLITDAYCTYYDDKCLPKDDIEVLEQYPFIIENKFKYLKEEIKIYISSLRISK